VWQVQNAFGDEPFEQFVSGQIQQIGGWSFMPFAANTPVGVGWPDQTGEQ